MGHRRLYVPDVTNLPSQTPVQDFLDNSAQPYLPDLGFNDSRVPAQEQAPALPDLPDQRLPTEVAYDQVKDLNPDEATKVINYSAKTNLPQDVVQKNLKQIEAIDSAPGPALFQDLHERFPNTAEFLSDPSNMAKAHDDIENLSFHERATQAIQDTWSAGKRSIMSSLLGEELALNAFDAQFPNASPKAGYTLGSVLADKLQLSKDPAQRAQEIRYILQGTAAQEPTGFNKFLYGAVGLGELGVSGGAYSLKYGVPVAAIAGTAAAASGLGLPAVIAAAKLGFGGGETGGGVEYNFKLFTGQELDRLKQMKDSDGKPLDPDLLTTLAVFNGAANAALGMVQLKSVVKTIPGADKLLSKFISGAGEEVLKDAVTRSAALKNFAYNLLKSTVHGFGTFVGMEGINIATEEDAKRILRNQSETDSSQDPFSKNQPITSQELNDRLLAAGKEGAGTIGLLSAFGHTSTLISDFYSAQKTAEAKQYYQTIGEGGKQSELKKRDPVAYSSLMAKNLQDTPVENIYLTTDKAEEYFQSKGIDIEKAMQEMDAGDAYIEAKATGKDIKIPFAKYLDKIVGGEHWAGLENDVKFAEDDHTPNELAFYERNKKAEYQKAFDAEAKRLQEEQDYGGRITKDVSEKLVLAGKTQEEALRAGQLHQAYFNTMGSVLGMDANDLYDRRKLQIKGGEDLIPGATQNGELLQAGGGEKQGKISFNSARESVISLFRDSNKSTFLHETGHLFLDIHKEAHDLLSKPGPLTLEQQRFMSDSGALLKWLGAESFDKLTPEHHEKFARGFEEYLREGKAPSESLRTAFRKFGRWLTSIYKNIKQKDGTVKVNGLELNLNPEIRGVMDRMLATQEEINAVRDEVGYKGDESVKEAPKQSQTIKQMQEQARSQAEEKLLPEQLKETTKEHEAMLVEKRAELTKNAKEQVKEIPIFKAWDFLRDAFKSIPPDKVAHKILSGEGNANDIALFESAADVHGFADMYHLANELILAKENNLRELEINRMVDDGMLKHSGLLDPDVLHEAALEAIHNDKMADLLALEKQIYSSMFSKDPSVKQELSRRRQNEARVDARLAKERAARILSNKTEKEATNYRTYITAERNAAVKVSKALERGDQQAAAEYKDQQLLNHQLAAEALRNKKESVANRKYLDHMGKKSVSELLVSMPKAFANQVNGILSSLGIADRMPQDLAALQQIAKDKLSSGESPYDIANSTGLVQDSGGNWVQENLRQFVQRIDDDFYAMKLPDSIIDLKANDYRDLTMAQIRDLKFAIKTIAGVGRGFDKWTSLFDKADMKASAAQLRKYIEAEIGAPWAKQLGPGSSNKTALGDKLQSVMNIPDFAIGSLVNLSTVCKYLDLQWNPKKKKFEVNPDGPAQNFIYRVLKAAGDGKLVRYEKMVERVKEDVLLRHFTEKEFADLKNRREYISEIDRTLTREEMIAVALNWGNESSRDRVRVGFGWTDEHVSAVLNHLTKKEWDFAQSVWDHLQTYWPETVELEMRINGVEPTKIPSSPVSTKYGEYRGGYYPVEYDPMRAVEALKNEIQKTELFKRSSTAAASTDQGRVKERLSYVNRPVRLEIGKVLFNHLEDIAHDLSYRESIIDVSRFLNQRDTSTAIVNAIGPRGLFAMQKAVDHVAKVQREDLSPADSAVRWMKSKSQAFALGLRAAALPLDVTGNIINAMYVLGPSGTASMLTEFVKDRHENIEFVENNSERMRHRSLLRDKDALALGNTWEGRNSAIKAYLYVIQSKADEAISYPMWLHVYKNSLEAYGHEKAVHIADDAITSSFGSGALEDQVGVQRYKGLLSIFGNFYSWQSMMFNQAWLAGKISGLEYSKGNTYNAIKVMGAATFYLWGMQALQENMWKEYLRNNQSDDPEARKKRMWARFWQQPFGYVWGVRDIANYFTEKKFGGQPGSNYRLGPIEQSLEMLTQPLFDKEFDTKFGKHVISAASFAAGVPNQVDTWMFNYIDWLQNNGHASWRDLITRRTKK
jgi:hypothetical protein